MLLAFKLHPAVLASIRVNRHRSPRPVEIEQLQRMIIARLLALDKTFIVRSALKNRKSSDKIKRDAEATTKPPPATFEQRQSFASPQTWHNKHGLVSCFPIERDTSMRRSVSAEVGDLANWGRNGGQMIPPSRSAKRVRKYRSGSGNDLQREPGSPGR